MRGDLSIKELRRMGKKPTQVWLFLLTENQQIPGPIDPEDMLLNGLLPEVYVEPHEDPASLDFRFLTGVLVHLQGQNIDRLRGAFSRLKTCRPSRVIVSGAGIFHDTEEAKCKT